MRIISKSTLREFWDIYPEAEKPLRLWFSKIQNGNWDSPNQIKQAFSDADQVGNGRIVFNIARNKFRLIVKFVYQTQIAYVRFLGTHKDYYKIKNIDSI